MTLGAENSYPQGAWGENKRLFPGKISHKGQLKGEGARAAGLEAMQARFDAITGELMEGSIDSWALTVGSTEDCDLSLKCVRTGFVGLNIFIGFINL